MGEANFADKTIWTGDNLDILRGMNSECVDLIYLDPPFNSNKTYEAPVGSKAAGAAFKDAWDLSDLDVAWMGLIADEKPEIAYLLDAARRTHGKGMQSYLTMMAVRLLEMRRALKETGSIYLHCDPYASHYLKMLMDAVFGQGNFRNEIIWSYNRFSRRGEDFPAMHDILLYYTKSQSATFNPLYTEPRDNSRYKRGYHTVVDNGVRTLLVYDAGKVKDKGVDLSKYDRIQNTQARLPRLGSDWHDIPILNPQAKERTGYPTQKPLALLERIIEASSNPGDVVLDPFCGCATACVAAEKLARRWVGIDLSAKAAELVNVRLQQTMGSLFHHGYVTARVDIPKRTDIDAPIPYRQNKHVLYGQQEGLCNGCGVMFPFRNFTVDHVVPQSRGGTDHLDNLQLLCGACNSVKGDRPQEHLIARLKEMAI